MRYDVCISFEGTHRKYARRLADALRGESVRVFFDEYEQTRLWGTFLHDSLGHIYAHDAYFCIVLLSKLYYEKMYTNVERRAILITRDERNSEYILPIKLDEHPIPDALQGIAYISPKSPKI